MKHLGTILKSIVALAMLAGLPLAHAAGAVEYPANPVRIIIPYPPGGAGDLVARYVAARLTEKWGKAVVVENRPGGGTVIGATAVAQAAPDGYTLLYTANSHIINAHLMKLPYDPMNSFAPITTPLARLNSSTFGQAKSSRQDRSIISHRCCRAQGARQLL